MKKHKMTPLEQSIEYSKGDTAKQRAWEDGFVAGSTYQKQKQAEKIVLGKEPQYLYVSQGLDGSPAISFIDHQGCIGKIKLEKDDG